METPDRKSTEMIQEKMARQMYAKNREKIIKTVRDAGRGYFIVNFYNNCNVQIIENQDSKAEFSLTVPSALETLDVEFNKALSNYLVYGKNHRE
jgi:hypothetical protein